jgi:SAM-dependent methyltransferase
MARKKTEALAVVPPTAPVPPLRLDLGCGKNKREGFVGVDVTAFPGVDVVADLATKRWPWADDSVDEVHCSHMVEHLDSGERVFFINELHRVLKKGAKATLITPHWASMRAYGDLTHKWPPVSEFWFYYLSAEWRKTNAPHNDGYTCDFEASWGYALHPTLGTRALEHQQFAMQNYKEACQDTIATLTKR